MSKEEAESIEKDKKYDHIWSSNAIEGSSLSKYETAALLETGLTIHGKPFADPSDMQKLIQWYQNESKADSYGEICLFCTIIMKGDANDD